MSKIKSPQEKKALSLKKDRRNIFGHCPTSSRKNIRRGKQRSHMKERHALTEVLNQLRKRSNEDDVLEADAGVRTTIIMKGRKAFKKMPDAPLGVVIRRKKEERQTPPLQVRYPTIHDKGIFDVSYERALHKTIIMMQLRRCTGTPRWGPHKKKSERIGKNERRVAARWKDAILRDAPLLKGFFAEQPEWREKMLRWCEKALQT